MSSEKARKIAQAAADYFDQSDDDEFVGNMALDIDAAIAEEREGCAKLAQGAWLSLTFDTEIADADICARVCEEAAAAIRARS